MDACRSYFLVLSETRDDYFRLDVDKKKSKEPTLAEMTAKAVELLEGSEKGFVLFVESALIDKVTICCKSLVGIKC